MHQNQQSEEKEILDSKRNSETIFLKQKDFQQVTPSIQIITQAQEQYAIPVSSERPSQQQIIMQEEQKTYFDMNLSKQQDRNSFQQRQIEYQQIQQENKKQVEINLDEEEKQENPRFQIQEHLSKQRIKFYLAFQDSENHKNNLKQYKKIFLILIEENQENKIPMKPKSENIAYCTIEIDQNKQFYEQQIKYYYQLEDFFYFEMRDENNNKFLVKKIIDILNTRSIVIDNPSKLCRVKMLGDYQNLQDHTQNYLNYIADSFEEESFQLFQILKLDRQLWQIMQVYRKKQNYQQEYYKYQKLFFYLLGSENKYINFAQINIDLLIDPIDISQLVNSLIKAEQSIQSSINLTHTNHNQNQKQQIKSIKKGIILCFEKAQSNSKLQIYQFNEFLEIQEQSIFDQFQIATLCDYDSLKIIVKFNKTDIDKFTRQQLLKLQRNFQRKEKIPQRYEVIFKSGVFLVDNQDIKLYFDIISKANEANKISVEQLTKYLDIIQLQLNQKIGVEVTKNFVYDIVKAFNFEYEEFSIEEFYVYKTKIMTNKQITIRYTRNFSYYEPPNSALFIKILKQWQFLITEKLATDIMKYSQHNELTNFVFEHILTGTEYRKSLIRDQFVYQFKNQMDQLQISKIFNPSIYIQRMFNHLIYDQTEHEKNLNENENENTQNILIKDCLEILLGYIEQISLSNFIDGVALCFIIIQQYPGVCGAAENTIQDRLIYKMLEHKIAALTVQELVKLLNYHFIERKIQFDDNLNRFVSYIFDKMKMLLVSQLMFNRNISSLLLCQPIEIFKDEIYQKILEIAEQIKCFQKHSLFLDIKQIVNDLVNNIYKQTITIECANELCIQNKQQMCKIFEVFGIQYKNLGLELLQQNHDQFLQYKKRVQLWIQIHKKLQTLDIQQIDMQFQQLSNEEAQYINILYDKTYKIVVFDQHSKKFEYIFDLYHTQIFQEIFRKQNQNFTHQPLMQAEKNITITLTTCLLICNQFMSYLNQENKININIFKDFNIFMKEVLQSEPLLENELCIYTLKTYLSNYIEKGTEAILKKDCGVIETLSNKIYMISGLQINNALYTDIQKYISFDRYLEELKVLLKLKEVFQLNHQDDRGYYQKMAAVQYELQTMITDQTSIQKALNFQYLKQQELKPLTGRDSIKSTKNNDFFEILVILSESKQLISFIQKYTGNFQILFDDGKERSAEFKSSVTGLKTILPFLQRTSNQAQQSTTRAFLDNLFQDFSNNKSQINYIKILNNININISHIQAELDIKLDRSEYTIQIIQNILKNCVYSVRISDTKEILEATVQKVQKNNGQLENKTYTVQDLRAYGNHARVFITALKKDRLGKAQDIDFQKNLQRQQYVNIFTKQIHLLERVFQLAVELRDYGYFDCQNLKIEFKTYQSDLQEPFREDSQQNEQRIIQIIQSNTNLNETIQKRIDTMETQQKEWKQQIDQIMKLYPIMTLISQKMYFQISELIYKISLVEAKNYDIDATLTDQQYQELVGFLQFALCQNQIINTTKQILFQNLKTNDGQFAKDPIKIKLETVAKLLTKTFSNICCGQNFIQQPNQGIKGVYYIKIRDDQNLIQKCFNLNKGIQLNALQFLFCKPETKMHVIELFLNRWKYHGQNQNYFIVNVQRLKYQMTKQLKEHILNTYSESYQDQLTNILFVIYDEKQTNMITYFAGIRQYISQGLEDDRTNNSNIKYPYSINERVTIVHSSISGMGKSFYITREAQRKQLSLICVPVYGDFDNNKFIDQIKQKMADQNIQQTQKFALHITLYECSENINILLFECLFLGLLNSKNERFYLLPQNMSIYIEVSNTLADQLFKKVMQVLSYFKNKHDFKIQNDVDYSQEHIQLALFYLQGLDSSNAKYFIENQVSNRPRLIDQNQGRHLLDKYFFRKLGTDRVNFYQLELFTKQFIFLLKEFDEYSNPFSIFQLQELKDQQPLIKEVLNKIISYENNQEGLKNYVINYIKQRKHSNTTEYKKMVDRTIVQLSDNKIYQQMRQYLKKAVPIDVQQQRKQFVKEQYEVSLKAVIQQASKKNLGRSQLYVAET